MYEKVPITLTFWHWAILNLLSTEEYLFNNFKVISWYFTLSYCQIRSVSKGGVPVSFCRSCLYTLPLQSQWQSRKVYSLYTQFSGGPSLVGSGRYLYTFNLLFLPDLPKLKWIHNKDKNKGSRNMFVKQIIFPQCFYQCYICSRKIV